MSTAIKTKASTSIRIDADLLNTLKKNAKKDNRSLSNYLETILFDVVKRPNQETLSAISEAKEGKTAAVDISSYDTFVKSILNDNENKED